MVSFQILISSKADVVCDAADLCFPETPSQKQLYFLALNILLWFCFEYFTQDHVTLMIKQIYAKKGLL